jgi:hypothetical protein
MARFWTVCAPPLLLLQVALAWQASSTLNSKPTPPGLPRPPPSPVPPPFLATVLANDMVLPAENATLWGTVAPGATVSLVLTRGSSSKQQHTTNADGTGACTPVGGAAIRTSKRA